MKIIVSCNGGGLNGAVADHFGRCPEFVLVETKKGGIKSSKTIKNPFFGQHVPFAVPEFLSSFKPRVLITQGIGPRAVDALNSFGVKVVLASGKAGNAVKAFLKGDLKESENVCLHD